MQVFKKYKCKKIWHKVERNTIMCKFKKGDMLVKMSDLISRKFVI